MEDIERVLDFATRVDEPNVWSELGHSHLKHDMVADAIGSYLRGSDASNIMWLLISHSRKFALKILSNTFLWQGRR